MSTRQKRESRFSGLIIPAICLAILGYFAHHAQTGRYNIYTSAEMDQQAVRLEQQLLDLQADRIRLERKVKQLTMGTLERDALDELARSELGLIDERELVILY